VGDFANRPVPTNPGNGLFFGSRVQLVTTDHSTYVVLPSAYYSAGYNANGELGNSNFNNQSQFGMVPTSSHTLMFGSGPLAHHIFAAFYNATAQLDDTARIYPRLMCFGWNANRQCGANSWLNWIPWPLIAFDPTWSVDDEKIWSVGSGVSVSSNVGSTSPNVIGNIIDHDNWSYWQPYQQLWGVEAKIDLGAARQITDIQIFADLRSSVGTHRISIGDTCSGPWLDFIVPAVNTYAYYGLRSQLQPLAPSTRTKRCIRIQQANDFNRGVYTIQDVKVWGL
jgi:hypothetical protein